MVEKDCATAAGSSPRRPTSALEQSGRCNHVDFAAAFRRRYLSPSVASGVGPAGRRLDLVVAAHMDFPRIGPLAHL